MHEDIQLERYRSRFENGTSAGSRNVSAPDSEIRVWENLPLASRKNSEIPNSRLIRPQTYPSLNEPDEEIREAFKRRVAEVFSDPASILVFQDEVHFSIQSTITREWAQKGSEPKVKSYPGRRNASYSGFVIPETGQLWVDSPDWFNFETTIASLRRFLTECPPEEERRYCIVMDNAPWHKKARRLFKENKDGEFDDIIEKAEFLFLPPYSPDLNPIEQVWRITRKKKTHNRFFRCFEVLKNTVDVNSNLLRGIDALSLHCRLPITLLQPEFYRARCNRAWARSDLRPTIRSSPPMQGCCLRRSPPVIEPDVN